MKEIIRKTLLYKSGVEYADYSLNYAEGCSHGCTYPCYAMMLKKRAGAVKDYEGWKEPKIVSNALELLEKELPKLKKKIKNVFLCFTTDPFMYKVPKVTDLSLKIIKRLGEENIRAISLTKGLYPEELADKEMYGENNEYGITLVSLSEEFKSRFEPFSAPIKERIAALKALHGKRLKTWVSIEPYPTPNVITQDIEEILETVSFADRIVFAKWNYNNLIGSHKDYKLFYNETACKVIKFCRGKKIDLYIKKGTINLDSLNLELQHEPAKQIRTKAVTLIGNCIKSQSTKIVLQALEILFNVLKNSCGQSGRAVSKKEISQWISEQLKLLDKISDLAKNTSEPILHIQIISGLKSYLKLSNEKKTAIKASSIISKIPDSFDLRLMRALINCYDRDIGTKDFEKNQKQVDDKITSAAKEVLTRFKNSKELFKFLDKTLSRIKGYSLEPEADRFLYGLGVEDYKAAVDFCKFLISSRSPNLSYVTPLLSGIRKENINEAIKLIELAVQSKNPVLYASVAHGYAWCGWASSIENGEISFIKKILASTDRNVKLFAIKALSNFPERRRAEAIELALGVDIENDGRVADSLCGIFNSSCGIPAEQLTENDLKKILSKLKNIKRCDVNLYHLNRFLIYCAARIPQFSSPFEVS